MLFPFPTLIIETAFSSNNKCQVERCCCVLNTFSENKFLLKKAYNLRSYAGFSRVLNYCKMLKFTRNSNIEIF